MLNKGPWIFETMTFLQDILARMQGHERKKVSLRCRTHTRCTRGASVLDQCAYLGLWQVHLLRRLAVSDALRLKRAVSGLFATAAADSAPSASASDTMMAAHHDR